MNILTKPACGNCGSSDVTFYLSALNVIKLVAAVAIAAVSTEIIPLQWRCGKCKAVFFALGGNVCNKRK